MGFYLDLTEIGIDQFKETLKTTNLIPSWKVLEEDIDSNFNAIEKQGINNLEELRLALKTKDKIQEFSKESMIPDNYLTILNRVVNGYKQKPVRFKDFGSIEDNVVGKLANAGIKNTSGLYDKVLTNHDRKRLSEDLDISQTEIVRLAKLTDLTRIRWVNHTFAYVLLLAGYDTAKKVAHADSSELYNTIKDLNEEKKIYNAHIGLNDMKMCIESAKMLDFEIEY